MIAPLLQTASGQQRLLGYLALLLILLPTGLALYALVGFAGSGGDWALLSDPYLPAILLFSLQQASLSALLSVGLAWPVARALYYLPRLPAKALFLSLCLLCFVIPALVLITGLVVLLGRSGWLLPYLPDSWNLYGLHGILLAHVFMNMPFAIRTLYLSLHAIPDTSWRLARQLKLTPFQCWLTVEWPALAGRLPLVAGFIFILCFNSFAVVLALGGGPQATTLEVAIYQALKYDFNIPEALVLAWLQLLIAGGAFLLMQRAGKLQWLSVETAKHAVLPVLSPLSRLLHSLWYGLSWLLLSLPLLAIVPRALTVSWERMDTAAIITASTTTLLLGGSSALLCVIVAYVVLLPLRQHRLTHRHQRVSWLELLSVHNLIAPAMVVSVGLYIFFLQHIDLDRYGIWLVMLINMLVLIPFVIQPLKPRLFQFDDQYARLGLALKLTHRQRLQLEWPWLRTTLLSAFALVLVMAMGEITIFSIFGSQDWQTLPWLIYSYAGTYRIAEAAVVSVILLVFCGLMVWLLERRLSHAER